MERVLRDLAVAARRLRRAPAFTAIATLTLALGVGANTAVFSLLKAVVLEPLPYADAGRLVMVWNRTQDRGETTWLSGPETRDYQGESRSFERFAAYTTGGGNLTGGTEPERVSVGIVTPNLFETLGVRAAAGRAFSTADSIEDIRDRVVLGHGLWVRRFGGRPDIVGQSVQLSGTTRTILGVMPASFRLPLDFSDQRPTEMWIPLDLAQMTSTGDHSLLGVGRLRRGVTAQQANAALTALERQWVDANRWRLDLVGTRSAVDLKELVLGDTRSTLWILLGASGFILLIACANVANLALARSDGRRREVAVRVALGASRQHVLQHVLTESLLLSALGAAAGVGLAFAAVRVAVAVRPAGVPRLDAAGIDAGALGFALALAVLAGTVCGLAPTITLWRPDLTRSLKDGGRGALGRYRRWVGDGLAASQMAFSVMLLIGAGLLLRSYAGIRAIDLGFTTNRALTLRAAVPTASYPTAQDVNGFFTAVRRRLGELPGVLDVGATRLLPLTGTIGDWSITLEGRPRLPSENPNGDWQVVTPGYFEAMRIPLRRGRSFTDDDDADAPVVAVVNETMARRYWPDADPVGRRFYLGTSPRPWITIVGIVGRVRHNAVIEPARAEMYVPHAQWAAAGASPLRAMTFVLRTADEPLALLPHVRDVMRSLDPAVPLAEIRTLDRVARDATAPSRLAATLLASFAGIALTLAGIGVYGVLALLVARRRPEIGVRMALGARPRSILALIVRRGMLLTAAGAVTGLVGAALLTRVLTALLYGVTRLDPVSFVAVPAVLGLVALAAVVVPAGRAARISPATVLRGE